MKKICFLLVTLLLLTSLCSCSMLKRVLPLKLDELLVGEEIAFDTTADFVETTDFIETTDCVETTEFVATTEAVEAEPVFEEPAISIGTQLLGIDGGDYGWFVSWQRLSLSDADAEKYPKLAVALERINADSFFNANNQAESFAEFALDEMLVSRVSEMYDTGKFVVLRADENIVCLENNTDGYYGGAHGFGGSYGYNFDTESGMMLKISDVVTDIDEFYDILAKHIYDNYIDELYTDEYATAEKLQSIYGDELNWSADKENLIVYFNPYEIASYASGLIEVKLPFAEHKLLFNAEYIY